MPNLHDSTPCSYCLCSRNLNLRQKSSENVVSYCHNGKKGEHESQGKEEGEKVDGAENELWVSVCICLMIVKNHRNFSQVVKSEGSRNAGEPSSSLALVHCLQQKWGQPDLGDQEVWE